MDGFFFYIITSFAKYRISNKSRGLNDPSASRKKKVLLNYEGDCFVLDFMLSSSAVKMSC